MYRVCWPIKLDCDPHFSFMSTMECINNMWNNKAKQKTNTDRNVIVIHVCGKVTSFTNYNWKNPIKTKFIKTLKSRLHSVLCDVRYIWFTSSNPQVCTLKVMYIWYKSSVGLNSTIFNIMMINHFTFKKQKIKNLKTFDKFVKTKI